MDRSYLSLKLIAVILSLAGASIPTTRCQSPDEDDLFTECSRRFNCGRSFTNLSYPFWGANRARACGHWGFELQCVNETYPVIQINGLGFRVLKINQSTGKMRIARLDMWDGPCSSKVRFVNTTLNYPLFNYARNATVRVYNMTLFFNCNEPDFAIGNSLSLARCGRGGTIYYANDSFLDELGQTVRLTGCENVVRVPISGSESGNETGLEEVLKLGFEVEYDSSDCQFCEQTLHGVCGSEDASAFPKFHCICGPKGICPNPGFLPPRRFVIIGCVSGAIAISVMVCILICCYRKVKSAIRSSIRIWKRMTNKEQDLEAVIRDGNIPVKRYKFKQVKKMTKSFKEKLGQGGYGDVYKGKLEGDGRLVAVKVLKASKGNGEEFINEVASISRTSHINIVTLLGFCLEGNKRALIYEFMPNGSLEKFIYKDTDCSGTNPSLEWDKLIAIASGIARGLEYLHRGCNTRILHFDIKPHNILLDEGFCPKISDFGLAKLCLKEESVVSLRDARGTIGYIAPEVVIRDFGGVSSKSDVYSYGMMILEMVGGRKNIKIAVRNPSEIYFPDWIYKHIEIGGQLELWGEMSKEENEIARKMVIVGLWCIQTKPSDRPSMSRVIEMLRGNLQALRIPPKPSISSSSSIPPQRFTIESSDCVCP